MSLLCTISTLEISRHRVGLTDGPRPELLQHRQTPMYPKGLGLHWTRRCRVFTGFEVLKADSRSVASMIDGENPGAETYPFMAEPWHNNIRIGYNV